MAMLSACVHVIISIIAKFVCIIYHAYDVHVYISVYMYTKDCAITRLQCWYVGLNFLKQNFCKMQTRANLPSAGRYSAQNNGEQSDDFRWKKTTRFVNFSWFQVREQNENANVAVVNAFSSRSCQLDGSLFHARVKWSKNKNRCKICFKNNTKNIQSLTMIIVIYFE